MFCKYLSRLSNKLPSHYNFCSQKIYDELLSKTPFLELKHIYGQAGTIKCKIDKIKLNILLQTIWEDYAHLKFYTSTESSLDEKDLTILSDNFRSYQLEGVKNEVFSFDDELINKNPQIKETLAYQNFDLLAQIPEYFSLDLTNSGSIYAVKADVSSKIIGNLNLKTTGKDSHIHLRSIKTEFCDISVEEGDLKIANYLEAYNGRINIPKGSIDIKRVAISNTLDIIQSDGNINLGACYIGQQFLKSPSNSVNKLSYDKSIQENLTNLENFIRQFPHLSLTCSNSKINIKNFQGYGLINLEKCELKINNFSPKTACIYGKECDFEVNLSELEGDSMIIVDNGELKLNLLKGLAVNIYFINEQIYYQNSLNLDTPKLLVLSQKNTEINRFENMNFKFGPSK